MEDRHTWVWSAPDARGVTCAFNKQRTRRRRRAEAAGTINLDAWPAEWRTLVINWLRGSSASLTHDSIFRAAGNARHHAVDVLEELIAGGWIELQEHFSRGAWVPKRLTWIDADGLREAIGVPRRDATIEARNTAISRTPIDRRLLGLHASLAGKPSRTILARARLIEKLDEWIATERSGTRQNFSYFSRGDTKSISSGEWTWLGDFVDMEGVGIGRHAPTLYIRAPLRLVSGNAAIDLNMAPDMIGITPETIRQIDRIQGHPHRWLLVENRTSFEDVARRRGDKEAVVWMPGFAPTWWIEAMSRLLALCRAPALIAADPDPAGIGIAMHTGKIWGDNWTPWAMSPAVLDAMPRTKTLSQFDKELLISLLGADLPVGLRELAACMLSRSIKGEQEAIDLLEWIP